MSPRSNLHALGQRTIDKPTNFETRPRFRLVIARPYCQTSRGLNCRGCELTTPSRHKAGAVSHCSTLEGGRRARYGTRATTSSSAALARSCPTPATRRRTPSSGTRGARDQSALCREHLQCLINARLPARSRRTIGGHHITIHAQADEFLRRALLWTALSSVPTNSRRRCRWQRIHQGPRLANLFGGPLWIFRIRTTGVLL